MDFSGRTLLSPAAIVITVAMPHVLVHSAKPVTLLGAAQVTVRTVKEILRFAPMLVAADGGANVAFRAGVIPDAVIGDFDSVSARTLASIPAERLHKVSEQETTDFEKALTRIDAPAVLCIGFTGSRVDHALAVWNTVVRFPGRNAVVISATDVVFAAPASVHLPLEAGTRVSLFPMARVRAQSTGLHWTVDAVDFAPDGAIGTSNRATGAVTIRTDRPGLLVILPRACLKAVIAALARPAAG